MKMARFQTFWIQMRKNKPLDVSRKTGQTSGTKVAFYSRHKSIIIVLPEEIDVLNRPLVDDERTR
ncbi:hypothetical protein Hanom_Chr17g01587301 [Helianthus anomalus]